MEKTNGQDLTAHCEFVQSKIMFPSQYVVTLLIYNLCFTCRGHAWSSEVLVRNNNAHPWVECSNRGECDRDTG